MTPEQIEERISELEHTLDLAETCKLTNDTYNIQCELDNLYRLRPDYYCVDCE